jgi:hypothetical protein
MGIFGIKYHYTSDRKMLTPGVYKIRERWLVRIESKDCTRKGRMGVSSLGWYDSEEDAISAYQKAQNNASQSNQAPTPTTP